MEIGESGRTHGSIRAATAQPLSLAYSPAELKPSVVKVATKTAAPSQPIDFR
jgi:hypothetical protein